jgi:hypothetical protein
VAQCEGDESLHRQGGGSQSSAKKTRAKRYARFFKELAKSGNLSRSAKAAGVSRRHVTRLKAEDKHFRARFDEALDVACDRLEAAVMRRARDGVNRPVFYRGEQCGEVTEYSDTLAIFLLKGMRPEKYRHEAYVGVNAAQSVMDVARQLQDAHRAMNASVPTPELSGGDAA